VATAATATAGEAGDDDVEDADDAVNDGGQHGPDAVDDGHQAVADGSEDGFKLEFDEVSGSTSRVCVRVGLVLRWGTYARDDGTHFDGIGVGKWLSEAELGCWLRCCRRTE